MDTKWKTMYDAYNDPEPVNSCPGNAMRPLSADWIAEDKTNVDRTLAVSSKLANQIFGDFYVKNLTTRVMPVHSIPGLKVL